MKGFTKGKSKEISKGAGTAIKGGPPGGFQTGQSRTGPQKPGVSAVTKGGGDKKFGVKAGSSGGMFGKQSVVPARAGQSGKGSGGSSGGGKGKKGYGGDANGNPY